MAGGAWIHRGREGKELLLWDEGKGSRVGRHHQHHRRPRRLHHHSGFFLPFTNGRCMHYITLRLAEEEKGTSEGGRGAKEPRIPSSPAKRFELKQSSHRLTRFPRACVIEVANFLTALKEIGGTSRATVPCDFLRQSPLTVRLGTIFASDNLNNGGRHQAPRRANQQHGLRQPTPAQSPPTQEHPLSLPQHRAELNQPRWERHQAPPQQRYLGPDGRGHPHAKQ